MQQDLNALPIVIVGSGMGAYFLLQAIHAQNPEQAVVILTQTDGRFYPKPVLSSGHYHAKKPQDMITASAEAMMRDYGARIICFARVERVDNASRCVVYEHQGKQVSLAYRSLVLALGSSAKPLPIQGAEHVFQVNDIEAYELFYEKLAGKQRVAIIGSGLIGVEFAHDLAYAGYEVVMLSQSAEALSNLVPESVGSRVRSHLESMGVRWFEVDTVHGCCQEGDGYRLQVDELSDVTVDVVLAAVGLVPNTSVEVPGASCGKGGYDTDVYAQTGCQDVYAIGDCATIDGLHLTYVAPIKQQTQALAKTLLGERTAVHYPAMPVVIKTPTLPLTLVPVRGQYQGSWQDITVEQGRIVSAFYDTDNVLRAFVLCGEATVDRAEWLDKMPTLL